VNSDYCRRYRNGPQAIICHCHHKTEVGLARRGPSRPHTPIARARNRTVSSGAPHLSSRSIQNYIALCRPLTSSSGCVVVPPAQDRGKDLHGLDWVAGLAQGWAHPSSASEPQKTANHLPSSQHRSILHSSGPCNDSPCTLHHPCQGTRSIAVHPSALNFLYIRSYSASSRMFSRARAAKYGGLDHWILIIVA